MSIRSYEEIANNEFLVVFEIGGRHISVSYWHSQCHWKMRVFREAIMAEDIPLLEAAIHELRRLNGTLPPAKKGR